MATQVQDVGSTLGGYGKKEEEGLDEFEYSPFYGIEKGAVLQDARIFHDPNVDTRKAQQVITKLLYLLIQGETFTKKEASEVFFAATKLFQHKDMHLRRMIYLCIKEICPAADEVIIICSSLMKDMNSKVDLYRSNSIRVLCRIIDSQLLVQIERYLKQAVVDKSAVVASAVLCSAMHLCAENMDVVKRWSNEIQEAMNSKHHMVQFHAVGLMHAVRATDRLAVSKLVSSLTKPGTIRSPMAHCLIIRYVAQVIGGSSPPPDGSTRPFYDFLENLLRNKSEMVIFEAAKAITEMRDVTSRELTPAISVLQLFLSSSKPVLRFAAVRLLNKVAQSHPMSVTNCNIDMEAMIGDANRSVATLAITTLLKTGNEGSVDRLLKQIGNFMSDIGDDFKVVVVEAIRSLCLKFPQKYRGLMAFLSNAVREEGGFQYKKAIVDSILILIREIPEAKELGLSHLCEFIEDCEFTYLSTEILNLLGRQVPQTADPSKYIRYIYNRVILENATVRAAAVSALAQIAAQVERLRDRVLILLGRALHDNDDEVRDRTIMYLQQLSGAAGGLAAITSTFTLPIVNLEKALKDYVAGDTAQAFDLLSVPTEVPEEIVKPGKGGPAIVPNRPEQVAGEQEYVEMIKQIPQLSHLGQPFKTCLPIQLTEEETEYSVSVVKHIFTSSVLFQYNCTNTIAEQVLENVSVLMDLAEAEEFEDDVTVPLKVMPHNGVGQTYVLLKRPEGSISLGKFVSILRFKVKEVDPSSGEAEEEGFDDEYQLEDVDITPSDYIKPLPIGNFKNMWDGLGSEAEMEDEYGLGEREGIQETMEVIMGILGMSPCDGSDICPPNARSHVLLLAGTVVGDVQVLARVSFGLDVSRQVAMKLVVRSEDAAVSELIHQIIQEA
eukprot:TRINITY_DN2432_c1_g1_i1.p1 TRINITY_DN2432_c1_g1~~TRINITY_DN2432_c1_g1_i1.p1  ORF type:complete len:890 (-),score=110.07 TRINITY_DN2432_c1_g1_i1:397-3066(-)